MNCKAVRFGTCAQPLSCGLLHKLGLTPFRFAAAFAQIHYQVVPHLFSGFVTALDDRVDANGKAQTLANFKPGRECLGLYAPQPFVIVGLALRQHEKGQFVGLAFLAIEKVPACIRVSIEQVPERLVDAILSATGNVRQATQLVGLAGSLYTAYVRGCSSSLEIVALCARRSSNCQRRRVRGCSRRAVVFNASTPARIPSSQTRG